MIGKFIQRNILIFVILQPKELKCEVICTADGNQAELVEDDISLLKGEGPPIFFL